MVMVAIRSITITLNLTMKAVSTNLFVRGKRGNYYVRKRIPSVLREAYGRRDQISVCLRTSNFAEAEQRAARALVRIEGEFAQKRLEISLCEASLQARPVKKLTHEQTVQICLHWKRSILQIDELRRRQGMHDEEFTELGEQLEEKQCAFRRMLAQGKTSAALPEIQEFLLSCGIRYSPDDEEAQRTGYTFLQTMVDIVDHQMRRQSGQVVDTDSVAPVVKHPLQVVFPFSAPRDPNSATWEKVFQIWQDSEIARSPSATISYRTPWRELQSIADGNRLTSPSDITIDHLDEMVKRMKLRGLSPTTVRQRIGKLRMIYKAAIAKKVLSNNPALHVVCQSESRAEKRKRKRLAFDVPNLLAIFGSDIFTKHYRAGGQLGEASYWIPLLMFYTGARPEELAGLAVQDLTNDPTTGWTFDIIDRHLGESGDDGVPESHRRTLKCDASVRRIPVAKELLELGLLQYVRWLKDQGHTVFFPTLKKDAKGRLSTAITKFFGRYKKGLGITDPRKVMYSFRHGMKNYLEHALFPSKYLKRFLGQTTGDGKVTDGYGSDLPLEHIVDFFAQVHFPKIPALPWQPGKGPFKREKASSVQDIRATKSVDAPVFLPAKSTSAHSPKEGKNGQCHLRLVA